MPDITFTIAQRAYTLRCAPGQEDHLRDLAAALDARVAPLAKSAPGADDRRLLVIAALEMLDALQRSHSAPPNDTGRLAELERENAALRAWAGSIADRLDVLVTAAGPPASPEPGSDELVPDAKDA